MEETSTSAAAPNRAESAAFRRVVLAALVLVLLFAYAIVPRMFTGPGGSVGRDAPDFTLRVAANPLDGKTTLRLADLKGSAVILDFWATWCGPCQAEAPLVDRIAQRYKDRGLVVVGVNTSDQEGNLGPWVRARKISFTVVYDADNSVAETYGVHNLPTLVVISRTGKILAVRQGITGDAELERLVKQAL